LRPYKDILVIPKNQALLLLKNTLFYLRLNELVFELAALINPFRSQVHVALDLKTRKASLPKILNGRGRSERAKQEYWRGLN